MRAKCCQRGLTVKGELISRDLKAFTESYIGTAGGAANGGYICRVLTAMGATELDPWLSAGQSK